MHYAFLLNFFADKKRLAKVKDAIRELENRIGSEFVHVHTTEYAGHAGILAGEYEARYGGDVLVVACGGDGTVHEVSTALVFTATPMAVLPMGSGNDFARSVLPDVFYNKPEELISRIDRHEIKPIDIMKVDCYDAAGSPIPDMCGYSVNITSFGLDTMVQFEAKRIIKGAKRLRLIRKNAYTLALIVCVIRGWDFRMKYSFQLADGSGNAEGETDYILSGICNGQYYGGGYHPAPDAELDDGVLDACIVEDIPLRKVLPVIPKYKKGTHLPHPNIRTFRITGGVISAEDDKHPLKGNYEGEDFCADKVAIEIKPKVLQFAFFSI